jgi:putative acetyltransferase
MPILPADFDDPQVLDLLQVHLAGMHANSPPGHVFALDLSGLKHPSVSFYAAWEAGQLHGFGAIKEIAPGHGELKSMRTAAAHLRKGVAAKILEHLLSVGRARGYKRVSLETGTGAIFEPALTLYRRAGFTSGGAFGAYTKSDFNQFMVLDL